MRLAAVVEFNDRSERKACKRTSVPASTQQVQRIYICVGTWLAMPTLRLVSLKLCRHQLIVTLRPPHQPVVLISIDDACS